MFKFQYSNNNNDNDDDNNNNITKCLLFMSVNYLPNTILGIVQTLLIEILMIL